MSDKAYTVYCPKNPTTVGYMVLKNDELRTIYFWDTEVRYIGKKLYTIFPEPKSIQIKTEQYISTYWNKTAFTFDTLKEFKEWFIKKYFEHIL